MNLTEQIEEAQVRLKYLKELAAKTNECSLLGHNWVTKGGAHCGCFEDSFCSIAVHECTRCGDCDYGVHKQADDQRANCEHRLDYEEEKQCLAQTEQQLRTQSESLEE